MPDVAMLIGERRNEHGKCLDLVCPSSNECGATTIATRLRGDIRRPLLITASGGADHEECS